MRDILHIIFMVLHVLGATIIVGSSFVTLVALVKPSVAKANLILLKIVWRVINPVIGLQILTGLYLGINEWSDFGKSPLFWTKLVLTVLMGAVSGRILREKIEVGLLKEREDRNMLGTYRWALILFLTFLLIATLGVVLAEGS